MATPSSRGDAVRQRRPLPPASIAATLATMPRTFTTRPGPEPRFCETHDVLCDGEKITRLIEEPSGWGWWDTGGTWRTVPTRDEALVTAVLDWCAVSEPFDGYARPVA